MLLKKLARPLCQVYSLVDSHPVSQCRPISSTRLLFDIQPVVSNVKGESLLPEPKVGNVTTTTPTPSNNLFTKDDPFFQEVIASAAVISKPKRTQIASEWEDVPVARTTGVVGRSGKERAGRIGIFWGNHDEQNVYKELELGDSDAKVSIPLAELEAVNLALRQAIYEKKLNRVVVESDSQFVVSCVTSFLPLWRNNGFVKKDGQPVKNKVFLEELGRLLSQVDARVVFVQHKTRTTNDVIRNLNEDSRLQPKLEQDGDILKPQTVIHEPPAHPNVVYTSGKVQQLLTKKSTKFTLAGYGIHWPARPKEDDCGRYAKYPITPFRSQLSGIIRALEIATQQNLEDVHVVTDSDLFLKFRKWNWTKRDGQPIANKDMYERIQELEQGMKVTYGFLPTNFNKHMERATMLAEDGMCFPVSTIKQTT